MDPVRERTIKCGIADKPKAAFDDLLVIHVCREDRPHASAHPRRVEQVGRFSYRTGSAKETPSRARARPPPQLTNKNQVSKYMDNIFHHIL